MLMVNIGSLSTGRKIWLILNYSTILLTRFDPFAGGRVIAVKADLAKIGLTTPVCTSVGEKIALSRRVEKHWRLIGWGQIRNGIRVKPSNEN